MNLEKLKSQPMADILCGVKNIVDSLVAILFAGSTMMAL